MNQKPATEWPISLDYSGAGNIYIEQNREEEETGCAPEAAMFKKIFGDRIILSPRQAEEVVQFILALRKAQ